MSEHEYHLMQLADSFFPSGMFGFSGGLESLVKTGRVKTVDDVLRFVRNQMKFQVIPCESVALMAVMAAAKANDIAAAMAADEKYYSIKLVQEVRTASARSGRQLLNCVVHMTDDRFAKAFYEKVTEKKSAGTYPASLAIAATATGIPEKSALRMMLYSYCASMMGSAIRLGVISHLESQSMLTRLAHDVNSARASNDVNDMWQLTPLVEILQMQHELDDLRMFIT